jgi:hypothetical protein
MRPGTSLYYIIHIIVGIACAIYVDPISKKVPIFLENRQLHNLPHYAICIMGGSFAFIHMVLIKKIMSYSWYFLERGGKKYEWILPSESMYEVGDYYWTYIFFMLVLLISAIIVILTAYKKPPSNEEVNERVN